jgi:cellulose biosynthesis protein BcsQ
MNTNKRQKIIQVIAELGGSGKSTIATNLVDELRLNGKETAAYLLDMEQITLLTRMGQRDVDGELLAKQTNPLLGVVSFDILNQQKKEAGSAEKEGKALLNSFMNDYDYSVYDFPGQGRSQFEKLFLENELAINLDLSDKDIDVVIPVSEKKSLVSVSKIREMYTFKDDFVHLNNRVRFIVMFNPIKNSNVDLTYSDYLTTKEHNEMLALGSRYIHLCLQNIDSQVLDAIQDRPFSYYYDFEKRRPINLDSNPKLNDLGLSTVGIALRRLLLDPTPGKDSGFYHIVPKYFF